MEERTRRALLFDFYGHLLTKKQHVIYDLYYQQDLSLGEIAELLNVSRQAVFDLLHRTDRVLNDYEQKLGLVYKYLEQKAIVQEIENELDDRESGISLQAGKRIKALLKKLEENW